MRFFRDSGETTASSIFPSAKKRHICRSPPYSFLSVAIVPVRSELTAVNLVFRSRELSEHPPKPTNRVDGRQLFRPPSFTITYEPGAKARRNVAFAVPSPPQLYQRISPLRRSTRYFPHHSRRRHLPK